MSAIACLQQLRTKTAKIFPAVSTVYMRIAALLIALAAGACSAPKTAPVSLLDLPLEQRLDVSMHRSG
jgi:hypothetical protein